MEGVAAMTEPYRAAMKGKWDEVKRFYDSRIAILQSPLTVNGGTVLHFAVYIKKMDVLRALLEMVKEFPTRLPINGGVEEENLPFQAKDHHGQTALHLAAAEGNLEAVELLLSYDEELLNVKNNGEETPLFLAASFGQIKVVKHLFPKIKEKKPHVQPNDKSSILHAAILGEYFETALELLNWDDNCREAQDGNHTTGFQLLANMPSAFKSGYRMGIFKTLLYYCLPNVDYAENNDKESDRKAQFSSSRNKVDLETGNKRENHQPSNQQGTADCPSGVSRVYNTFWRCIARVFPAIQKVWREKKKHNKALELAKNLAEKDFSWKYGNLGGAPSDETYTLKDELLNFFPGDIISPFKKEKENVEEKAVAPPTTSQSSGLKETSDEISKEEEKEAPNSQSSVLKGTSDKISIDKDDRQNVEEVEEAPPTTFQSSFLEETPFIAAARNGILEIVKAILDFYPQAIEHENKQNENIFHVVAKNRRAEILDFLLSSSIVPISRLRKKLNVENGDSILHSAAYCYASSLRERPGEALLMQSDLQWFERIEKIVPKYFINHRNKKKLTAQELFTKQHKQLVQDGQQWLRRTAEACTIVAVLIATVAFTCAYTVPGGSTDTGHPLLLKATPFSVFATSDALSLCFSLTSVVVFLSIMTSKMNEQDFRWSLPLKLVLGLTTLFLSVAFMMVAFSATLLLMIRERLHWAAIPLYAVACCPVTIFLLLQFPLYLNISWFTLNDLFTAK